ncbi:glycosyl hydrolase family 47-domain-containing protein [Plectosphaerella cucumerina]|uniref:alpha-1,2-Mannosidase n=1 Tax=Plectosphaerella cucumerina TaxID=40658 RepID=A0A8K0X2Y3_9PEZI|nr:glycosyl hydrolase family 47-domain-containing protein [Plectosphaerella cucumerina]
MMPRRRGRVTLVVAAFIVFILYRFAITADWNPAAYDKKAPTPNVPQTPGKAAPPAPAVPVAPGSGAKQSDADEDPALQPVHDPVEGIVLPDREGSPPMHNPAEPVVEQHNDPPPAESRPDQLPDLRDEDDHEHKKTEFEIPKKPMDDTDVKKEDMLVAVSALPSQSRPAVEPTPELSAPSKPPKPSKSANVKGLDDEEIHAKNPPGRQPDNDDNGAERPKPPMHWEKQTEHFPVPTESIIPLPKGSPKPFPKIQHDFKSEAETTAAKDVRLKRLAQVKAEAERAWSGYRKYAWTHDELVPQSLSYRDPFCGWAATLVDSLDTLWIMGLRSEFDEAVKAVAEIDFTYSAQRNDIPVFETIIRYLGGLLAAYDVSGGKEGKHQVLLDKALELAEILMGVFDTPNRMPILYYNWMPEYASQRHRAGTGSVAEVATMSMEFTRLAQLTGQDRFYDAIARITDALVDLQRRGTSIPGIFPESLDLSGCNKTASMLLQIQMNKEAEAAAKQTAVAAAVATSEPQGRQEEDVPIGNLRAPAKPDEEEGLPRGKEFEPAKGPEAVVHRRAVMVKNDGEVVTDTSGKERLTRAGKLEFPELPSNRHQPPPSFMANLPPPTDVDCPPQGIEPATWGYQQYSMGGSQDSAYEYFPKEDLLLGGLVPEYKALHVAAVDAVDKWLLYRPMVKDQEREMLFSAKLMTSGEPATDARYEFEVTHLTCFLGGMFALGGRIYDRPKDLETAKRLTEGCVWAYESMPSGIMPEVANVVPCAEREGACPFNETLWWEQLDPQGPWRDRNIKDWEDRQVTKQREREEALKLQGDAAAVVPGGSAPAETKEKEMFNDDAAPSKLGKRVDDGIPVVPAADDPEPEPEQQEQVVTGGVLTQVPISEVDQQDPRPQSHEEFVKDKIQNESIPPGFVAVIARNYILRPEAIESVWYMYRITGDTAWQEKGWHMFEAVIKATRTDAGHSAIADVLDKEPIKVDAMESFWLAETLKYFYLLFAEPDVISLDEWVLNTEAHPFKRPV